MWLKLLPINFFLDGKQGCIDVVENEKVSVIESDPGDGWTTVKKNGEISGYVPTSYLDIM